MIVQPGVLLGRYQIDALIGRGGMGEVYRARDTQLRRDVAVKVLPAAFSSDLERMARFDGAGGDPAFAVSSLDRGTEVEGGRDVLVELRRERAKIGKGKLDEGTPFFLGARWHLAHDLVGLPEGDSLPHRILREVAR